MLGRAFTLAIALTTSGARPQAAAVDFASAEAATRAEAARAEIAAELAGATDHAWAGSYYWGDGLGANVTLDLAPGAGFVFEWHGCMGLYGRNFGPVHDEATRIVLEPELPNKAGEFAGFDEEHVPVAWGPRRYLVAAGRTADFCNAVNDGSEPRDAMHGMFLLRRGDETKPVTGRPRTRDGELDCLLHRPIEARVASVGARRAHQEAENTTWYETAAVLDVGREQGVWAGMRFFIHEPGHTYQSGKVTLVHERSSEAVFSTYREEDVPARAGWRLSTRRD